MICYSCGTDELLAKLTETFADGGWVQLWTCYVLEAYAVNLWTEKGMCGPIHLCQAQALCACNLVQLLQPHSLSQLFSCCCNRSCMLAFHRSLQDSLLLPKLVQTQDNSELAAAKLCIHSLPALQKAVRPVRGCAGKPVKSAQGPDQLQFNAPLWHNWWIGMMW